MVIFRPCFLIVFSCFRVGWGWFKFFGLIAYIIVFTGLIGFIFGLWGLFVRVSFCRFVLGRLFYVFVWLNVSL